MFSETAYKNADACRFCWMCRHLCPVSLKTGREANSARAKGLLVSLIKRGEKYDESMAEIMWECCLCGACSNDCATGYEPRSYIREARSIAIAEGIAPENVMEVVEKMMAYGNMYGATEPGAELSEKMRDIPEQGEVLLYLGQTARYEVPEIAVAAIELLKKAGVNFAILKNEPVSGGYMEDMIGLVDEVRQKASELTAAINASGAKTVVVLDPIDARILKHEYREWNCAPAALIATATSYFYGLVESRILKPKKNHRICSIHDAGALCRDMDETLPVRKLAGAMGMEIREMFRHNDLAKSCGGTLLKQYDPDLSAKLAEGLWEELLRTEARLMVTEAPGSYAVLKTDVPEECALTDIILLLSEACC